MARMVMCKKLGRELPALDYVPFDDEDPLGLRIYNEISEEGWRMWLEHSKMLINEFRLDLVSPEAHRLLRERCELFFFGEGSDMPPEYRPQHR